MRFLPLLILALLVGCQRYKYEIDLKPDGAAMTRSLTVTKLNSDNKATVIPREEVERLASIYNAEVKYTAAPKASFAAKFQRAMPQDIGGAGTHATFETSLGTFHIYTERFRGQDDLLAQWERQEAAIDLFADLTIAWADQTLKGEQGLDTLRAFLDRGFRRDMKNAALYFRWSGIDFRGHGGKESNAENARETELAAMAAQYFYARGYFEIDDLPRLYGVGTDDDSRMAALDVAKRQLLRRMGRDPAGPLPASLAALKTPDDWHSSLEKFVQSDPGARARLDHWAATRKVKGEESPDELLTIALGDLISLNLLTESDELELRLQAAARPFATNGQWDEAGKVITWSRTLETEAQDPTGLPVTAVALWCEPSESTQQRLFGSPCLRDSELARYCLQRLSLPETQAEDWDAALAKMTPETTPETVRKFRFTGHEKDDSAPSIAETIAAALESRPTAQPNK